MINDNYKIITRCSNLRSSRRRSSEYVSSARSIIFSGKSTSCSIKSTYPLVQNPSFLVRNPSSVATSGTNFIILQYKSPAAWSRWRHRGRSVRPQASSSSHLSEIFTIVFSNFLLKMQKEWRIATEKWCFSIEQRPIILQLDVRVNLGVPYTHRRTLFKPAFLSQFSDQFYCSLMHLLWCILSLHGRNRDDEEDWERFDNH